MYCQKGKGFFGYGDKEQTSARSQNLLPSRSNNSLKHTNTIQHSHTLTSRSGGFEGCVILVYTRFDVVQSSADHMPHLLH